MGDQPKSAPSAAERLFLVQDADRPVYVVARDWNEAHARWQRMIRAENDMAPSDDCEDPQGIQLVAEATKDFPDLLLREASGERGDQPSAAEELRAAGQALADAHDSTGPVAACNAHLWQRFLAALESTTPPAGGHGDPQPQALRQSSCEAAIQNGGSTEPRDASTDAAGSTPAPGATSNELRETFEESLNRAFDENDEALRRLALSERKGRREIAAELRGLSVEDVAAGEREFAEGKWTSLDELGGKLRAGPVTDAEIESWVKLASKWWVDERIGKDDEFLGEVVDSAIALMRRSQHDHYARRCASIRAELEGRDGGAFVKALADAEFLRLALSERGDTIKDLEAKLAAAEERRPSGLTVHEGKVAECARFDGLSRLVGFRVDGVEFDRRTEADEARARLTALLGGNELEREAKLIAERDAATARAATAEAQVAKLRGNQMSRNDLLRGDA